ncbi:T9SS type A sorting domain-containing protein [Winogradskyella eximia]|uniref:T9SS type A sorting domain-containing protein n=1 Tax=Winogradskyella eximia TaxID=262006 RepID=UPI002491177B|nr:T9SS type A sorting domain-containing protein [Winogradskyella eximia]
MKQFYTTIILVFCLQFGFGQLSFQEQIITSNADYAIDVFSADIDGDGDSDLITAARNSGGKVSWFSNSDGLGNFENETIIASGMSTIISVIAFDVDNDGDNDVVVGVSNNSSISGNFYLFKNDDSLGTFSDEGIIASSGSVVDMVAADLDGDNDLDLVSPTAWFRNIDASGVFDSPIGIPSLGVSYQAKAVFVSDLDGDNRLDLLTVRSDGSSGRALWHKNYDGLGNFNSSNSYLLFGQYGGASDIAAGDFDNDGDNDVLISTSDNFSSNSNITILKNIDAQNNDFESVTVQIGTQTTSIAFGDLDNDGDLDVVGTYNGSIIWFENLLGTSTFGEVQNVNSTIYSNMQSVYLSDIDNDNDLDILNPTAGDDSIRLYENMGVLGNEISGTFSLNYDMSNCNEDNEAISNVLVSVNDNASNTFSAFTNVYGSYQVPVNISEFDIIPMLSFDYYQSNPLSRFIEFDDLGNTFIANFCAEPVGDFNDLQISIYPIRSAVPGFVSKNIIVCKNVGTTQLSGSVVYEFDDSKISFLSASEAITDQTSSSITFEFLDLNPFETRIFNLDFNVFTPPTTEIDNVITSTATINPVPGDETEEDNIFSLQQTVIGSYDPNDITVLEGEEITIEEADKYLHYLIRFQNTGTASAINVKVEHILDDKLDFATMQLESLSHTGRVEITNETDVSFIFNNINLADSTNDEPNSHGFIAYKIKSKSDVEVGDIISGTADIFFDFNPPIITNTVNTEIVAPLSVGEFNAQSIQVYPNPVKNKLEITSSQVIDYLTIVDINGRVLKEIKLSNLEYSLDVSGLTKGVYFLEIQSGESKSTKKFVKN